MTAEPDGSGLKVLDRALGVLVSFDTQRSEQTVTEVASVTGLPLQTASRLCRTLADKGYLERDPATRRYRLGPAASVLARTQTPSLDIRTALKGSLDRLADATGETAVAWRLAKDTTTLTPIDVAAGRSNHLRVCFDVGTAIPVNESAAGLLLLTSTGDAERERGLELAVANTTITGRAVPLTALVDEVREAKRRGWAATVDRLERGTWTVAILCVFRQETVALAVHGPMAGRRRVAVTTVVASLEAERQRMIDAVDGSYLHGR